VTIRVAYQGAPGAFGEEAARRLWPRAEPVGVASFEDVVGEVERHGADAGVLPIENVVVGPVRAALAALEASRALERIGEVVLPVRLHLFALPGAIFAELTEVVGHPVALAECGRALAHLRIPAAAWFDSAGAAALLVERNDRTRAVLAGDAVGARYGLLALERDLQDDPANATRFVGIRRRTR
jgi:prephenate dehydratase